MARGKWIQGVYEVVNRDKYIGKKEPFYRSGWEQRIMTFFDHNQHILQWGSECLQVPYYNPFKQKNTIYVPDFLINYKNKFDEHRVELIEVKPYAQTILMDGMKTQERAVVALNHLKWTAAQKFCKQYGIHFRIISEHDLFWQGKSPSTRR